MYLYRYQRRYRKPQASFYSNKYHLLFFCIIINCLFNNNNWFPELNQLMYALTMTPNLILNKIRSVREEVISTANNLKKIVILYSIYNIYIYLLKILQTENPIQYLALNYPLLFILNS